MDPQLYSETLQPFDGGITNARLSRSINQLAGFYQVGQLLKWDDNSIAIPVLVPVELPPLGNFDDLDIRPVEPILLVVRLAEYPTEAPAVYPDRLDFPRDHLAHLYIASEGRPPRFCLIRGGRTGINEWYANKQMKDLGIRVSNWLRDAAAGTLSENADQFEPLRLEGYNGTLVFDYDNLAAAVNEGKSYMPDGNFSLALFERFEGDGLNWKFIKWITPETFEDTKTEVFKEISKEDETAEKKLLYPGYVVWSPDSTAYKTYDVDLPGTWSQLAAFCASYGIDTAPLEADLIANDLRNYLSVPIVVAIRRPRPVIGYSGTLEFLNFHVAVENVKIRDGKVDSDAVVKFKQHKQPVTTGKAQEMSGFFADLDKGALVAGCGALGARIALNLAKSGTIPVVLSDPGVFSPHNFLRHPLSASYNGMNKAAALLKEITRIYEGTTIQIFWTAKPAQQIWDIPPETYTFSWIYDFTASTVFLNALITANIAPASRVARAYITDFGDTGLLLFEGQNRNPRIDDLQVLLYGQSAVQEEISHWLSREAAAPGNASFINIGIGCHTETTVLSNDYVDLHAALISGDLKMETNQPQCASGKALMHLIERNIQFDVRSLSFEFQPLSIHQAANSDWQIRMANGIIERMHHKMRTAAPRETGGVFIGCANYKTRTIHVVDLIDAPPDSKATEVCFTRGIEGLPDTVKQIQQQSGGQLGYIGEWHSHPDGPEGMSTTDCRTVGRFHRAYRDLPTPMPVFLMILTPNNILPFVFE